MSLATDLGMGQPLGHGVRCCVIATGLAQKLGLSCSDRSDVFFVALLRYVGCTSDALEVAQVAGDEIALAVAVAPFAMGDSTQEQLVAGVDLADTKTAAMRAHCEAAGLLAARLRLGDGVVHAVRHGFERWDGTGHPAGLAGPAIPEPSRIAVVARDVELWARRGGHAAAVEVARSRRGKAYDPAVVDAFCAVGESLLRNAEAGWPSARPGRSEPRRTPSPVRAAPVWCRTSAASRSATGYGRRPDPCRGRPGNRCGCTRTCPNRSCCGRPRCGPWRHWPGPITSGLTAAVTTVVSTPAS